MISHTPFDQEYRSMNTCEAIEDDIVKLKDNYIARRRNYISDNPKLIILYFATRSLDDDNLQDLERYLQRDANWKRGNLFVFRGKLRSPKLLLEVVFQ